MGASVPAVMLVILAGAGIYGAAVARSFSTSLQDVEVALLAAESRVEAERQSQIDIDSVSYNGGANRVTILVTNKGAVTYTLDKLNVLLDGVPSDANITSKKVDTKAQGTWPPETQLELLVTSSTNPGRVAVVTPSGTMDFWG
ncbi:MAG: hypothetical protein ACT4PT_09950 [Methanobacteriota archaeon]